MENVLGMELSFMGSGFHLMCSCLTLQLSSAVGPIGLRFPPAVEEIPRYFMYEPQELAAAVVNRVGKCFHVRAVGWCVRTHPDPRVSGGLALSQDLGQFSHRLVFCVNMPLDPIFVTRQPWIVISHEFFG